MRKIIRTAVATLALGLVGRSEAQAARTNAITPHGISLPEVPGIIVHD